MIWPRQLLKNMRKTDLHRGYRLLIHEIFTDKKRTLAILGIGIPLLVLFIYVALRSGPLAPVPVMLTVIENKSVTPALFGIGTVEARYTHKIGPTTTGRLKRLDVHDHPTGHCFRDDRVCGGQNYCNTFNGTDFS